MQKVKAFAVLKPGIEPTEAVKKEILAYCEKHIARTRCYDMSSARSFPRRSSARWRTGCSRRRQTRST